MDAKNGRFRERPLFPGRESRLPICRLYMSIRYIGRKFRKKQKAPVILNAAPACLLTLKMQREHTEEEMIPVENIKGRLFLVGAEDDSFWETGKYIRRMDERLKERPHTCEYVPLVYEHGTHFVLPESFCFARLCLWDLNL